MCTCAMYTTSARLPTRRRPTQPSSGARRRVSHRLDAGSGVIEPARRRGGLVMGDGRDNDRERHGGGPGQGPHDQGEHHQHGHHEHGHPSTGNYRCPSVPAADNWDKPRRKPTRSSECPGRPDTVRRASRSRWRRDRLRECRGTWRPPAISSAASRYWLQVPGVNLFARGLPQSEARAPKRGGAAQKVGNGLDLHVRFCSGVFMRRALSQAVRPVEPPAPAGFR